MFLHNNNIFGTEVNYINSHSILKSLNKLQSQSLSYHNGILAIQSPLFFNTFSSSYAIIMPQTRYHQPLYWRDRELNLELWLHYWLLKGRRCYWWTTGYQFLLTVLQHWPHACCWMSLIWLWHWPQLASLLLPAQFGGICSLQFTSISPLNTSGMVYEATKVSITLVCFSLAIGKCMQLILWRLKVIGQKFNLQGLTFAVCQSEAIYIHLQGKSQAK